MFPTTTTSSSGNDSSGVRVLLEAKMKQGAQMHPEEQPFGKSGKTGREGHNVICTPPSACHWLYTCERAGYPTHILGHHSANEIGPIC